MALSKHQQRLLPANRARIEVKAVDGSQLAPTTPQAARLLVKNRAAVFHLDRESGHRWLQMLSPCGTVLPPVLAQPGTSLPIKH